MLIQQLSSSKMVASDRFYRTLYESLLDPRLLTSSKQAMYLNLLFRSLKSDINAKRVQAFVKRLLQVITLHQPPFVCGTIYLLKELEATFPSLRAALERPEDDSLEDVEQFRDVLDPEETSKDLEPPTADHPVTSDVVSGRTAKGSKYDGRKRDPEHSNADKSCLWELVRLFSSLKGHD